MATGSIIDTHCHLDFDAFDTDRQLVIERARDNNVSDIIIPATQKNNWETIRNLCVHDDHLHACYGLHPYWTDTHTRGDIETLDQWASSDDCVGIGECGLDYREGQADKDKQLQLFEAQLNIANNHKLPITIHSINATEDIINLIKKHSDKKDKVNEVIAYVRQSGGLEYASKIMLQYRDDALEILRSFPPSDARNSMEELVLFVTDRKK